MTTAGPGRIRPLRADATLNSERIIAAARRVFTKGDGSGSLEEIAAEAGVGIATLYRHFAHREVLAGAVYTSLIDHEMAPALDAAMDDPSPLHGLQEAAERLTVVISQEVGLVASSGNFAAMTDEMVRRLTIPLQELVRRAQDAGEIRPDLTPEDVPRLLVLVVAGLAVPGTAAEDCHRYLGYLFDGVRPRPSTDN